MAVGLVPNMIRQTKGVQMEVLGGVQVAGPRDVAGRHWEQY